MTSSASDLRRLEQIKRRVIETANLKMLEPKNLVKSSWVPTDLPIDQAEESNAYLIKRAKEELEEFIKNPSYSEAGDVNNFMAMILDNFITAASVN